MFYCDPCADKRKWPKSSIRKSFGPCELCSNKRDCSDIPASELPIRISKKPERPEPVDPKHPPKDMYDRPVKIGSKVAYNLSGNVALGVVKKIMPVKKTSYLTSESRKHTFKVRAIGAMSDSTVTNSHNMVVLDGFVHDAEWKYLLQEHYENTSI
jgi:hypothetical protein